MVRPARLRSRHGGGCRAVAHGAHAPVDVASALHLLAWWRRLSSRAEREDGEEHPSKRRAPGVPLSRLKSTLRIQRPPTRSHQNPLDRDGAARIDDSGPHLRRIPVKWSRRMLPSRSLWRARADDAPGQGQAKGVAVDALCLDKAEAKFFDGFAKAEAKAKGDNPVAHAGVAMTRGGSDGT